MQQWLDLAELRLKKDIVPSRIQQSDSEYVFSLPEKFSVRGEVEVDRAPGIVGRRPHGVEIRIGSVVGHVEHTDPVQVDDEAVIVVCPPNQGRNLDRGGDVE